jgi:Protein of unknown function (DUF5818)
MAMRVRDQLLTGQGVLSMAAIAVMLGYAAHAMQIVPEQPTAAYAEQRQVQPPPAGPLEAAAKAAKTTALIGTVVRNGPGFLLQDSLGAVYRLDDPSKAQRFAGKPVKVTGKLDETVKLLHIETIEEIRA